MTEAEDNQRAMRIVLLLSDAMRKLNGKKKDVTMDARIAECRDVLCKAIEECDK